jgi:hypothetical protein
VKSNGRSKRIAAPELKGGAHASEIVVEIPSSRLRLAQKAVSMSASMQARGGTGALSAL